MDEQLGHKFLLGQNVGPAFPKNGKRTTRFSLLKRAKYEKPASTLFVVRVAPLNSLGPSWTTVRKRPRILEPSSLFVHD